ncbi:hypothetical protein SAMN05444320_111103 [Streptoalloteichus hindustanus]|uniref:Uncharacterized protein n=1 Tax=Streptoalloteichus hindustanus TaxID=2017 RepID=A0A1M5LG69_STRHI|nr:hypothetical protein SAMN05444320_111103 [Streptoalloteichus hindustanus]
MARFTRLYSSALTSTIPGSASARYFTSPQYAMPAPKRD